MKQQELSQLLTRLRQLPKETEWVEFKEAKNQIHFDDLGKYFSALSNEANLKSEKNGWLVLGIQDKTRKIVGTNYRHGTVDKIKHELALHITNGLTFEDIWECNDPSGRVLIFQIPPAPCGLPIAYKGHYYGRDGSSLGALNIHEIEQIRAQQKKADWTAHVCEGATIEHLDPEAIAKARSEYKKRRGNAAEVNGWDDSTFLNKAKITIEGKVTRAAILLLGKSEASHFLSPSPAQISWFLQDEHNNPRDFEHFGSPFILTVDKVLAKIRNLRMRFLPPGTLFPEETTQYDPIVIREALHNCIAHQDYDLNSRINVVERPDEVLFENAGSFIPGSVEAVIRQDAPPKLYRNPFLAQAMTNLRMIETEGGGIKEMFKIQRERFFPLPTYEIDKPDEVRVRISGKIINENYTHILMTKSDLELSTVIILDKVQKKREISKDEHRLLKQNRLVEGRYPRLFVSSGIATITGEQAEYIKNRSFDKQYYKDLVKKFLKEYKQATRKEIENLLSEKLPKILDSKQKTKKISNILSEMASKDKDIKNAGTRKAPRWVLSGDN